MECCNFFKMTFLKQKIKFLAQPVAFYALLGSARQTHKVVFLLFDGHLTAIFDATKLPQFLVLPIYVVLDPRSIFPKL